MVTVNADFSNTGMAARYERSTAPSVVTPASADRQNLEAPNRAITASGEALAADQRRRDVEADRRRNENAPPRGEGPDTDQAAPGSDTAGAAREVFHRRFDKTVAYDEEFGRTFTDITLASENAAPREGLAIRIPSENLVKRLDQAVANITEAAGTVDPADGIDLDV